MSKHYIYNATGQYWEIDDDTRILHHKQAEAYGSLKALRLVLADIAGKEVSTCDVRRLSAIVARYDGSNDDVCTCDDCEYVRNTDYVVVFDGVTENDE